MEQRTRQQACIGLIISTIILVLIITNLFIFNDANLWYFIDALLIIVLITAMGRNCKILCSPKVYGENVFER